MSYVAKANQYIDDVLSGKIPACKWTKLACERQKNDLKRSKTKAFGYKFEPKLANKICYFVELLPHTKGDWARPKMVNGKLTYPKIILEPWQCFILTCVFGWVHKKTGLRRFKRVYEEVARKNAKSTKQSGVALYMMTADGEPGAECYSLATTGDQARIIFNDARRMAERESEFCKIFGVDIHVHDLAVETTASLLRPLNAEGSTLDGLNVHYAGIDEFHAHKKRELYDVIDSATGARSQPIIWMVTTAGTDRTSICYEQRTHLTKVLDGVIEDDNLFGVIYTIDEGDDWTDPQVWAKANPNYGVSVLHDDMQSACIKAQSMSSALNNFLTKRLNVWVASHTAWMDVRKWDACADKSLTLEQVAHLPCYVALDLASSVDISAKIRLFIDADNDKYYVFGDYYLPESAVENSRNSQYSGWARDGYLHVTDGEVTDYDVIETDVEDDCSMYDVREVPFDPFQATQLSGHLIERGVPMVVIRATVQNFSEPMKFLETLVLQKKIVHNGDPVLAWMISNIVAHLDAKDNIYPRRERVENKIDGVVALIMALNRAMFYNSSVDVDGYLNDIIIA